MKVISHRGYWKSAEEKNKHAAFVRSFESGFGTETDIRDLSRQLVISHDMPSGNEMRLETFFQLYKQFKIDEHCPLALNIKADGLQKPLMNLLNQYSISNYFLFDMSLPDLKVCVDLGLQVLTRLSEFERDLPFYDSSKGIWLDAFYGTWYNAEILQRHLDAGKQICIVSAELHKREHLPHWNELARMNCHLMDNIILCTDLPEDAKDFFAL